MGLPIRVIPNRGFGLTGHQRPPDGEPETAGMIDSIPYRYATRRGVNLNPRE